MRDIWFWVRNGRLFVSLPIFISAYGGKLSTTTGFLFLFSFVRVNAVYEKGSRFVDVYQIITGAATGRHRDRGGRRIAVIAAVVDVWVRKGERWTSGILLQQHSLVLVGRV
jgi:hypothetical protein